MHGRNSRSPSDILQPRCPYFLRDPYLKYPSPYLKSFLLDTASVKVQASTPYDRLENTAIQDLCSYANVELQGNQKNSWLTFMNCIQ